MRRLHVLIAAVVALTPTAPAAAQSVREFRSPSGNIACAVTAMGARCDVRSHTWRAPRQPVSCEFDWGDSLGVTRGARRGRYLCVSDAVGGPGVARLAYGRTVRVGSIRCTSRRDGMRCANGSAHGFLVGRETVRRF